MATVVKIQHKNFCVKFTRNSRLIIGLIGSVRIEVMLIKNLVLEM